MAETTSEFHPNVKLSFGPMLIGVFFNMILYGILIVQTYMYYHTYRKDTLWIRIFVAYLFLLETANAAFDMAMMWQPLIEGFGTREAVQKFPTLFSTEPIVMVFVSTPIQCFFAWRIQRITQSFWVPILIVTLSAASMAGGIWTGIKLIIIKLFARKPELHESALLWFLTSCVADVMITATLVRSLSQRKTGFVVTDSVIDKIIRLTVQTGMITAICAIGDVIFFMTLPRTALNFLWDLALSKLYANCLLSTLNARASLNSMSGNVSSQNQRNFQLEVGSNIRRPTDRFTVDSSRNMSSPRVQVFELDNTKSSRSFGTSSEAYVVQPAPGDVEYGITVTKVVETLSDPMPASEWR